MPRPYNYIGPHGQYKGVGNISQSELDATGLTSSDWTTAILSLNSPTPYGPDMQPVFDFGQVVGKGTSNTLGSWLQNNASYLLIGGLVGLFLFKR